MGGYRRRKLRGRIPRKVFVIVCEGEKTERIYFNRYKTRYSYLRIETPNSRCTDPINLAKFSRDQIKKEALDLKNGDSIWCVFDCDDNDDENISKACKIAGKDIKICLSNPSFELWFLLHFSFVVPKLTRSEVIEKLKEHIPGYEKNKDYYDILLGNRPTAIDNAKKLIKMHETHGVKLISVESNPSTQVQNIVEEILRITEK
ncbi:MAG: RloB family protein [Candidatus Methanoperedens sp.]|nr:RloB family protein [Candidatus Methanoperedens sp.]MCZ7395418.1 RloB family protein [Candidatus Methanoperedens sp.]